MNEMDLGISTSRLRLRGLSEADAAFIFELVNSPGWLRYIGDRQVVDLERASAYISKILGSSHVLYIAVETIENGVPIGIITLIKREYLEHRDIGFAFLPEFEGCGYAVEAAQAVLNQVVKMESDSRVLATTLPENIRSIKLLERLGLQFEKSIHVGGEELSVFVVELK